MDSNADDQADLSTVKSDDSDKIQPVTTTHGQYSEDSEVDIDYEEHQNALRIFTEATPDSSTNAIAVYDSAGKFATVRERDVKSTAFQTWDFKVSDNSYRSTVTAARMKNQSGREVLMFPSDREQLIEDCLRKMAARGRGVIHKGATGVVFTLYELREELKRYKHTLTYDSLREGIEVMQGANLLIEDVKTQKQWKEHFLSRIIRGGIRSKVGEQREVEKWFVGFHLLVTESIVDRTYRQMDYPRLMAIRGVLPKYLYKRMVLLYTYAELTKPYQPSMKKTLIESGRGLSLEQKNNVKAMKRAFAELKKEGAIDRVEEDRKMDGRTVVDIRYSIYPTEAFVNEVIEANKMQKRLMAENSRSKLAKIKKSIRQS